MEREVYPLSIPSLSSLASSSPFLISPLPRFLLTPFRPPLEGTGALASLMAGADVGVCAGTNKTPAWETTGSSHLPRLMALGCPLAPSEPAEEPLMLCCLRRRPRRNGAPFSPRCFSPDLLLNFVLVREGYLEVLAYTRL